MLKFKSIQKINKQFVPFLYLYTAIHQYFQLKECMAIHWGCLIPVTIFKLLKCHVLGLAAFLELFAFNGNKGGSGYGFLRHVEVLVVKTRMMRLQTGCILYSFKHWCYNQTNSIFLTKASKCLSRFQLLFASTWIYKYPLGNPDCGNHIDHHTSINEL